MLENVNVAELLLNRYFLNSGLLKWNLLQKKLLLLLKMVELNLSLTDGKRTIWVGWKIFVTGVFLVNYGGDTKFQLIIITKLEKWLLQKKILIQKIIHKIQMCLILGFHLDYGHFLLWVGQILKARISKNSILLQLL